TYAFTAELERLKIRDRTVNGRLSRAAEGKWVASRVPYGYRRVGVGQIVPDPEAAAVVRLIFDLYDLNMGMRSIAIELNARGYRTHLGYLWAGKTVRYVLMNEAVCGVVNYREVRV